MLCLRIPALRAFACVLFVGCLAGRAAVNYAEETPSPRSGTKEALTWRDLNNRRYGGADVARKKATVFFFGSTQCPISDLYTARMAAIARDYHAKGVQCFFVATHTLDTPEVVKTYLRSRGVTMPAIKDEGAALAGRLGASVTPQAVVLDAAGAVRYLGRIDDSKQPDNVVQKDVREALDAILAGRPVPRPRTLPSGCTIFRDHPSFPAPGVRAVTYTQHIAPILQANCVVCHRAGDVGPFSLESYGQARPWAAAIKDYTSRRLMPPWKPVAGYGEFHDERRLSDAQIAQLALWADQGAQLGSSRGDAPPPRSQTISSSMSRAPWLLGTPDMVLGPDRPYHLAAEGADVYRNFVLPADFQVDRFLRAIDFLPGNRAIVHHIVTYIDTSGVSANRDGKEKEPGYSVPGVGIGVAAAQWGEVWVPGSMPRFLPEGVAIRIPAGSRLVMQVHYHKTGRPEQDRSQAALYFMRGKVEKVIQVWPFGNMLLAIPAGSDHHVVKARVTVPVDVTLRSIFPHMHMIGKEMRVTATLPDGTVKRLIFIDDWDFNWQATYYYKQPVPLPKGTKLELVATYNNSARNPRQTSNPPRLVEFGEQTTDEMCFAFLGVTVDGADPSRTVRPPAGLGVGIGSRRE